MGKIQFFRQISRVALIIFLPLFIVTSSVLFAFYYFEIKSIEDLLLKDEIQSLKVAKTRIADHFDLIVADLLFFSNYSQLLTMLNHPKVNVQNIANDLALFSRGSKIYDQVRIIDADGKESVRVNFFPDKGPVVVDEKQLQVKRDRYYFGDTFSLPKGEIFVSPLDLNIEHGEVEKPLKPIIRFGTPIFDKTDNKRGIVMFNYLAEDLIRDIEQLTQLLPGQCMMLNSGGYWLINNANPEMEWGFMFEHGEDLTMKVQDPKTWEIISSADTGQFKNSKGLYTFVTVYPLIQGWHSSTGAGQAFEPSLSKKKAEEYFWKIIFYLPKEPLAARIEKIQRRYISIDFMALILLLLIAFRLARAKLTEKKALIDLHQSHADLEEEVRKRTAELSTANNQLKIEFAERLRLDEEKIILQEQLHQAQKMESVGRLAGGVAHDYNNMLSVILGYTQMALEKTDPNSSLYKDLEEVLSAANRSTGITRQLLAFARKQTIITQVLDLSDIMKDMINMLGHLIGEDINLSWQPTPNLWLVKIDPSQIDQLLANLCVNARDAIAGVGEIHIETDMVSFEKEYYADHGTVIPGDYVLLSVSDSGCGMKKEILDKIFEPFFTTKELGHGTGLGLSTVYGVVKQNNGFIQVYSEFGKGTTFKIFLPRYLGDNGKPGEQRNGMVQRGQGETVLVVEDETAILRLTDRILKNQGYKVLVASGPVEAIDIAHKQTDGIDLLLSDLTMPDMNGRDLAKQILAICPNIKVLFMSGYIVNFSAGHDILDKEVNLIQKPFSAKDLATKVFETLSRDKKS